MYSGTCHAFGPSPEGIACLSSARRDSGSQYGLLCGCDTLKASPLAFESCQSCLPSQRSQSASVHPDIGSGHACCYCRNAGKGGVPRIMRHPPETNLHRLQVVRSANAYALHLPTAQLIFDMHKSFRQCRNLRLDSFGLSIEACSMKILYTYQASWLRRAVIGCPLPLPVIAQAGKTQRSSPFYLPRLQAASCRWGAANQGSPCSEARSLPVHVELVLCFSELLCLKACLGRSSACRNILLHSTPSSCQGDGMVAGKLSIKVQVFAATRTRQGKLCCCVSMTFSEPLNKP